MVVISLFIGLLAWKLSYHFLV